MDGSEEIRRGISGIYSWICKVTNRVYVGQAIDVEKNSYLKRKGCPKQIRLHNSFMKYGFDNHKFIILEYCSIEDLNKKERYYQDLYVIVEQ